MLTANLTFFGLCQYACLGVGRWVGCHGGVVYVPIVRRLIKVDHTFLDSVRVCACVWCGGDNGHHSPSYEKN